MLSRPHFIILPDVLICVQAQAEAGRGTRGCEWLAAIIFIIVFPDVVGGPKGGWSSAFHGPSDTNTEEREKKKITERGIKTSFATPSTLSGFIAVGVSKDPTWPRTRTQTRLTHTHTQMHTHNERVRWRGKQEKQGDEADCVGELCVCEWDWSRGKYRCVVDSADKWRMKGCCVGEFGLRSAARSAPMNSTFFVFLFRVWARQPAP